MITRKCLACGKEYHPRVPSDNIKFCSRACFEKHRFLSDEQIEEGFWKRVKKVPGGCWEWLGIKWIYGMYWYRTASGKRRTIEAHRYLWRVLLGHKLTGLVIHHKCENKFCVNPAHFEIMPQAEHAGKHSDPARTHCKHGHEFTPR